ncbi:MAG TPA: M23 family metallopeptidase [Candidatus Cybelea sp.]|nr:M23 family metallopeptidase [Candidatus Cybelea sp.]
MRHFGWLAAVLTIWVAPALADVTLAGHQQQGGLMMGRAAPGATVLVDGRAARVAGDGQFVFGFGRDHPADSVIEVRFADGRSERRILSVASHPYDIQRVDGLPQNMVTPNPEELERIKRDNAEVAKVREIDSAEPLFRSGWIWPVIGTITSIYGSQRILNGEPRQPHYGIDIAAPEGTPVKASTDGVVLMAEPDMLLTGGTIIVDHGFGLSGAYSHLSKLLVKVGDRVRQGDTIGLVGHTGRVTASHLDWRVNWFDQRLDPALLVGPMPDH